MSMSLASIIEKNKVSTNSVWLMLLEIQIPGSYIYIVQNNVDIFWNNITWIAFPFEIGDTTVNDKEAPNITIKVSNITRDVGVAVSAAKGGSGLTVVLRVVNSELLSEGPVVEESFQVIKSDVSSQWVTFTIGSLKDLSRRFPSKIVMQNFCSYVSTLNSGYCGIECGLPESKKVEFPSCDGSIASCRKRGNTKRFGGELGLDRNLYS